VSKTREHIRRLKSGFVLVLACAVPAACGGDGDGLPGPEPELPADEGVTPSAGCADGVPAGRPLALPDDQVGGQSLAATVNGLGYAYSTTSYRRNGLLGPEGAEDMVELEATVRRVYRPDPGRSVLVGVSEGGMVAGLAAERHPALFDGALAACGPVGSLRGQLDYFVDFRVVFDYLFPGVIPGTAVDIPADVNARWETTYVPAVVLALATSLAKARELVSITEVPVERDDAIAIAVTAVGILWYNVKGTADARQRLGGQPFDNSTRVYAGSQDDAGLNAGVARFTADPAALVAMNEFETTGNLQVPVVTLHTTGDPIVPFEQQSLYTAKVTRAGATSSLTQNAVERYGHCNFEANELIGAFSSLIGRVRGPVAVTNR